MIAHGRHDKPISNGTLMATKQYYDESTVNQNWCYW
jgi:hypothetical protein